MLLVCYLILKRFLIDMKTRQLPGTNEIIYDDFKSILLFHKAQLSS